MANGKGDIDKELKGYVESPHPLAEVDHAPHQEAERLITVEDSVGLWCGQSP